jgi:hypothetical protein
VSLLFFSIHLEGLAMLGGDIVFPVQRLTVFLMWCFHATRCPSPWHRSWVVLFHKDFLARASCRGDSFQRCIIVGTVCVWLSRRKVSLTQMALYRGHPACWCLYFRYAFSQLLRVCNLWRLLSATCERTSAHQYIEKVKNTCE